VPIIILILYPRSSTFLNQACKSLLVFTLLGAAVATTGTAQDDCAPYLTSQGGNWHQEGGAANSNQGGLFEARTSFKVTNKTKNKGYTYTVSARAEGAPKGAVWIQADRLARKGTGQQFKVKLISGDTLLAEYWILPNKKCTTKSIFSGKNITAMLIESRDR
jgi:hypothetical protein